MTQPVIKIFTRSFSKELYSVSRQTYAGMGLPIVRLTDQSADGYFHTMLKDTGCDIAVNIDEDAFVVSPDAIMELAMKAWNEDIANIGCPDGGAGGPRGANPIVTNPYFNILNLKLIRTRYTEKKDITNFDFRSKLSEMAGKYDTSKLHGNYNLAATDAEPYYPFFFWLAYNFKTLYLNGEKHSDTISSILYAPDGRIICLHSWFARFYNTPLFLARLIQKSLAQQQKQRIDNLADEAFKAQGIERHYFTTAEFISFKVDVTIRWIIKVPQRICGWPAKLRKKFGKRL